jgi:hemerythrin
MKKIQWDESLSVGVDVIDGQHQKWMEHYNRTLSFLIEYTDMHFTTEEGIMTRAGYPELDVHKAKHDELRQTVANLIADYEEEGETAALDGAVDTFLGNWLIDHIRQTDQVFGWYVKEKGIVVS